MLSPMLLLMPVCCMAAAAAASDRKLCEVECAHGPLQQRSHDDVHADIEQSHPEAVIEQAGGDERPEVVVGEGAEREERSDRASAANDRE